MPLDLGRDIVARWQDPDPKFIPVLREASVNAVVLESPNDAFERACRNAGIQTISARELDPLVEPAGLWPGISRGPNVDGRGDETASASREPWVDSNGYRIAYLRALHPDRPPVLGYLPNEKSGLKGDRLVPYDTLELALIEAWVAGGNYVLSLEPRYREALLAGDPKASAAWKKLGQTAAWLQKNITLFRQPVFPTITALVERSGFTSEIANLLFRRNGSPSLVSAAHPPAPDPARILALVAAAIRPPSPEVRGRILAHAEAGASVIVDAPGESAWWRAPRLKFVRKEFDRDFYTLGQGQLVAYHKRIADPSEFALDVIDIVTHKRRAVRLWNAPAVIPLAGPAPNAKASMHAVNYGAPADSEIQARVQGTYSKAVLLRPEAGQAPLKTARRGDTTEVFLPEIGRLAVVVFS